MNEQPLIDNITKLLQRVRRSAQKSQFGNSDILVLAASKTRASEDIRAAYACGLSHFGESYVQEALGKMTSLENLPLTWHFIGPIQSNKTRAIAENFHWVHSIERAKIASRLNQQRPHHLPALQVCIQVNISRESSKSGATLEQLPQLISAIAEMPRLQLRGLMAIPAASTDERQQRASFAQLREALLQMRQLASTTADIHAPGDGQTRTQTKASTMDTLSMGMSADLDAAIQEGATIVRIGTAIFGPRNR